jgi:hypothetical protein
MHRKFAAWLSDKSWRAALFAAIFGALSPQGASPVAVLAGAVPILMALRVGRLAGMQSAMAGSAATVAVLLGSGLSLWVGVGFAVGLFWVPLGLGLLLQRTEALNLSFQLAVLGAGVLLALLYAGLDDPVARWQGLVQEAAKEMTDAGLLVDQQAVLDSLAASNWGTYVAIWVVTILGALFVARWWHSQLEAPGAFGLEYQQLRLGKLLGAIALLVVVGGFAFGKLGIALPVVDAWMWIAVTALAFQGLAAAHKLKASGVMGRGWLTAIYVLLLVPISTMLTIVLLAGWGLADNWQRTRARSA